MFRLVGDLTYIPAQVEAIVSADGRHGYRFHYNGWSVAVSATHPVVCHITDKDQTLLSDAGICWTGSKDCSWLEDQTINVPSTSLDIFNPDYERDWSFELCHPTTDHYLDNLVKAHKSLAALSKDDLRKLLKEKVIYTSPQEVNSTK
jgi:hypothetical protein